MRHAFCKGRVFFCGLFLFYQSQKLYKNTALKQKYSSMEK